MLMQVDVTIVVIPENVEKKILRKRALKEQQPNG